MRNQTTRIPALLGIVLLAAAASLGPAGCSDECSRDDDCATGYACFQGECRPTSGADADADTDADTDVPPTDDGIGPDDSTEVDVPPDGADGDPDVIPDGADGDPDVIPDGADGDPDVITDDGDVPPPCTPETAATDCDDSEACTVDECVRTDTGDWFCRHNPRGDGEFCNDDLWCNGYEVCSAGACVSSGNPCSATGNPCASGGCDEAADECRTEPAADGTSCENGVYCDGPDVCRAGRCESGPIPCPSTGDACIFARCDEGTHACSSVPAPDGTSCDEGDPCNGTDTCNAVGVCVDDPDSPCDDWVACTTDICIASGGGVSCIHEATGGGGACTDADRCGGATDRRAICDTGGGGACAHGTDAPCGDGSLCTFTNCRGGTCSVVTPPPPATVLACNDAAGMNGANLFGANDVTTYGTLCTGSYTAGESVFSVAVPAGNTTLEVNLTSTNTTGGNLSVLILSDRCTATSCLASSAGASPPRVTATVTGGRTYYVVIDGQTNTRGTFTVTAACR